MINFEAFWDDWSDYILSLNPDIEDDPRAYFDQAYSQALKDSRMPLWRGMSVSSDWYATWAQERGPIGIYWSTDSECSRGFLCSVSIYDDRFQDLEKTPRPSSVLLRANVPLSSVDLAATIATQLASAESEIRLLKDATLSVDQIILDGRPLSLNSPLELTA